MAVTINIEFTDEQWKIVQDNLPLFKKKTDDEVVTPERMAEIIFEDVKIYVLGDLRGREIELAPYKSAFNA